MATSPFDFEAARRSALDGYARRRPLYESFANTVKGILQEAIDRKSIKVNSIEARAKSLESFGRKAITRREDSPEEPKYKNAAEEITDLAGVRVITFFPRTVSEVGQCIEEEFEVIEKLDHSAVRLEAEQLGYQSVHYLIRLTSARTKLPEYRKFDGLVAEVQVRTILQHAWAEIEHDIQYKSTMTIPVGIRRRFMALAGLLEIADREFQAVQEDDTLLRKEARKSIEEGQLGSVEITPDALHAYLDKRLGPDYRTSLFSYEWMAKVLRQMGFINLGQVENCIRDYNDDQLSRIVYGTRQGQLSRFEITLIASMGSRFLDNHPWKDHDWYRKIIEGQLKRFQDAGVRVGSFTLPLPPTG